MRVVGVLSVSMSLLSVLSCFPLSTWAAANPNACPNPLPYIPIPMNLDGTPVTGPTPDALHNDGMIGNITGAAGWCTDISNPDACPNPAGYQRGSYAVDNNPPFCLTIPNVRNHMVEIMVETMVPNNKICIVDTDANAITNIGIPLINQCAFGSLPACFAGPSGSDPRQNLTISISCSDNVGCATSDVQFWYRVRVSNVDFLTAGASGAAANSAVTSPEMWCSMIKSSAKFPSELGASNTVSQPATSAPTNIPPTKNHAQQTITPTTTTNALAMAATVVAALLLRA